MASTTPLPPSNPDRAAQYERAIKYTSISAIILCPILIALPPRKLDVYTVLLVAGTGMGANQVMREYTGRSITDRLRARGERMSLGDELPSARAREVQAQLREEKARRARPYAVSAAAGAQTGSLRVGGPAAAIVRAEREKKGEGEEEEEGDGRGQQERGVLGKIWLGGEGQDWKARRDAREKEALEDGRGYGGLIMDQIWEVWNWGREKAEDVKEEDERVVEARKESRK